MLTVLNDGTVPLVSHEKAQTSSTYRVVSNFSLVAGDWFACREIRRPLPNPAPNPIPSQGGCAMQDPDCPRSYLHGQRDEVGLCSRECVSVTVLRCKQLHSEPALSPIANTTPVFLSSWLVLAVQAQASVCVCVQCL